MNDRAGVVGATGEAEVHSLHGPGPDPEDAAKRLESLRALIQEHSRLSAAVRDMAEKAQAERGRAEQELEKTAQLRVSVEQLRLAAEQERQRAEAQASHARAARLQAEEDRVRTEKEVQVLTSLAASHALEARRVDAGRRGFNWALFWTALSSLAAVVACLFSFWATREASNSVHETRQATRATVLLQLLSEYSSQEMLESMKRLREFREAAGGASTLQTRYWDMLDGNPAHGGFALEQLNNDRRRVKDFFKKLKGLAEDGIIDQSLVKVWWSRSTLIYLQDVLTPIERANVEWMFARGRTDARSRDEGLQFIESLVDFFRKELG